MGKGRKGDTMLAWYQTYRPRDGAEVPSVTRRTTRADVLDEGSQAPSRVLACPMWPPFPSEKGRIIKLMMLGYKPSQVCLRLVTRMVPHASYCRICTTSFAKWLVDLCSPALAREGICRWGGGGVRSGQGTRMETWTDGNKDGMATENILGLAIVAASGRRHMLVPTQ